MMDCHVLHTDLHTSNDFTGSGKSIFVTNFSGKSSQDLLLAIKLEKEACIRYEIW